MSEPQLKVIVVDDEDLARDRLRRFLERESDVNILAEAANGKDAVKQILAHRPDVVFLDVQMPGLDGFGVLRSLRAEADAGALEGSALPLVVFVTAFNEHALRAFEVHAVDYVLKPIDPDRFKDAVSRARARHSQADAVRRYREVMRLLDRVGAATEPKPAVPPSELSVQRSERGGMERLVVKSQERLFFVKSADIDWVEADGNYAKLHVGGKEHLIRETMGHLEEMLGSTHFARIHRSTIVNLDRVAEMEPWFSGEYLVVLQNGTELRMSRWYRDKVLGKFSRTPASVEGE